MNDFKQPVITPIRFYDPNLEFDNENYFQNPDNRVSTGYNWEAVNPIQYALPIPRQWPDGQPGIDFLITLDNDSSVSSFYAHLYDEDNAYYKALFVVSWKVVGSDTMYRIYLDGNNGAGIADGLYTIKLFNTSGDALLMESEALMIADWFEDDIPFEVWNFENDFGLVFNNGSTMYTLRMMMPVRIYDPGPTFEKEVYSSDPGILTTLRTIPQRVFNFDSLPIPVHVAEAFQLAFACSELYLDRIKINSEESPEASEIEGSILKQIEGRASFVDFNSEYMRERVDNQRTDEDIDWASDNYTTATITGDSIEVDTVSVGGPWQQAISDTIPYNDEDLLLIKIDITDDAGDSDLPLVSFDSGLVRLLEWGITWFSFRVNETSSTPVLLRNLVGEKAVFTAVITVYSIGLH